MSAAHKEANSTSPIAQESHSIFFTESQDPLEYIASVKEIFHRPDQIAYISLIFLLGQVYFAKYEVIEARTNPENLPSFSSSYFSQTEGEIVLHRSVANTVIRLCNEVFFSLQKTQKAVSQMKESYIEKRMNAFQDESVLGKIQLLPFLLMQKVLLGEKNTNNM